MLYSICLIVHESYKQVQGMLMQRKAVKLGTSHLTSEWLCLLCTISITCIVANRGCQCLICLDVTLALHCQNVGRPVSD